MSEQSVAKKKEPESVVAMKELLKVERQIVKVRAILDELETKRAGLIEALKG